MTTPKIAKAMEYLDDELIAAAAEEQAAPRLLTKKKVLALLAACLLLVGTFAMMGMEAKPELPDPRVSWEETMKYCIELYKDDPEMLAYYTKWYEVGYDALQPYPAEWFNEDETIKDFVTTEMLYEVLHDSLLYQHLMEYPGLQGGRDPKVTIIIQDNKIVGYATEALGIRDP
ncbi:MAG: hypothetical protein IKU17_02065 [Clostridia bacterium]|nr:hypothetical protein [Clostridia bacterium]